MGAHAKRCSAVPQQQLRSARARTKTRLDSVLQLLDRRRTSETESGPVYPARQTYRRVLFGERIITVDQDGRGTVEPERLCFLETVHQLTLNSDVHAPISELVQSLLRRHPVGATVEILQGNLHAATVSLAPQYKVKEGENQNADR